MKPGQIIKPDDVKNLAKLLGVTPEYLLDYIVDNKIKFKKSDFDDQKQILIEKRTRELMQELKEERVALQAEIRELKSDNKILDKMVD